MSIGVPSLQIIETGDELLAKYLGLGASSDLLIGLRVGLSQTVTS